MVIVLVSFVNQNGVKFLEYVIDFEVIVGEGVKVNVNGCIIYIGNVCMVNCLGWDKGIG